MVLEPDRYLLRRLGFLVLPVRAELCFYDVFGVACFGARLGGGNLTWISVND